MPKQKVTIGEFKDTAKRLHETGHIAEANVLQDFLNQLDDELVVRWLPVDDSQTVTDYIKRFSEWDIGVHENLRKLNE